MTTRTASNPGAARSRPETLPMRDFAHSLPMALLRAREAVMNHFRPMLREFDLTEQQWRVLRVLMEDDDIEITELATRCRILSPSLSRILQRLDARGLVARRAVATDQRRTTITISDAGRHLFAGVAPRSEELYAHIAAAFGKPRLAALYELLRELDAALEEADD